MARKDPPGATTRSDRFAFASWKSARSGSKRLSKQCDMAKGPGRSSPHSLALGPALRPQRSPKFWLRNTSLRSIPHLQFSFFLGGGGWEPRSEPGKTPGPGIGVDSVFSGGFVGDCTQAEQRNIGIRAGQVLRVERRESVLCCDDALLSETKCCLQPPPYTSASWSQPGGLQLPLFLPPALSLVRLTTTPLPCMAA